MHKYFDFQLSFLFSFVWWFFKNCSIAWMQIKIGQRNGWFLIWAHVLKTVTLSTSTHHIGRRHLIELIHVVVHHVHWHRRLSIEYVCLLFAMLLSNPHGHRLTTTFWYHIIQSGYRFLSLFTFVEPSFYEQKRNIEFIILKWYFVKFKLFPYSNQWETLPDKRNSSWLATHFVL